MIDPWDVAVDLIDPRPSGEDEPWRTDPISLAVHLTAHEPRPIRPYRYAAFLSAKFVDAVEGRSTRQIWNVPGRYGKTTSALWGLVWVMDRMPWARAIYLTYGDVLAREGGVFVRDALRAYGLRCQLRRDRQRQDRFVTSAGGGLLAAGMASTVTGFGAGAGGGVLVDDPIKNWQEAHSPAAREKAWTSYLGNVRNRLDSEQDWIIVLHTRWHEDDLTGRLLAHAANETGEQWEHIALPAIAVDNDPLGRTPGEPLEPDKFTVDDVKARAFAVGSYVAQAIEQQNPQPEEGTELLRAWFRLDDTLPTAPDESCTSWDLKLKDREAGDYVVGQAWWRCGSGFWLVDQIRGQYDHATTANAVALLSVRHPEIKAHVIEAAGAADEIMPTLTAADVAYVVSDEMASRLGMNDTERGQVQELRRRGMPGLIPHPPKGDKSVRARTFIAPLAEAGNVHLDANAGWLPGLLDELASFPNGAHDDQVDAMSQALQRLSGRTTVDRNVGPAGVKRPSPWR